MARFDRARIYGLGLAVCPEKRKEISVETVRIRTLRTQQRAISQCNICHQVALFDMLSIAQSQCFTLTF